MPRGYPNKSRALTTSPADVQALIAQRQETHGDAWMITGELRAWLVDRNLLETVDMSSFGHSWNMILNKLIRILHDPHNIDHWRDIAGYAILVVNYLAARPAR